MHPYHPLYGKTFQLVAVRENWGEMRVVFFDDQGELRTLPATWTDVFPPDPLLTLADGRALFRVVDLLRLVRLIRDLPGMEETR